MKAKLSLAPIAVLVAATSAAAQSTISAPPSGLSNPGVPSISSPPDPSLSSPPNPSLSSPPSPTLSIPRPATLSSPPLPGLSTGAGLSAPPLPSLSRSFPSTLGSSLLGDASMTFGSSASNDGLFFVGRQSGAGSVLGRASSAAGVSSGLLDSLSEPFDLFELERFPAGPSIGVASGATSSGATPFSDFCRPEDFTCD